MRLILKLKTFQRMERDSEQPHIITSTIKHGKDRHAGLDPVVFGVRSLGCALKAAPRRRTPKKILRPSVFLLILLRNLMSHCERSAAILLLDRHAVRGTARDDCKFLP